MKCEQCPFVSVYKSEVNELEISEQHMKDLRSQNDIIAAQNQVSSETLQNLPGDSEATKIASLQLLDADLCLDESNRAIDDALKEIRSAMLAQEIAIDAITSICDGQLIGGICASPAFEA